MKTRLILSLVIAMVGLVSSSGCVRPAYMIETTTDGWIPANTEPRATRPGWYEYHDLRDKKHVTN